MKKQNFLVLMVLLAMMSVQVVAQQKGKFVLNTEEDVFSEGEAFFMKPGHTAIVEKDLLLVSFSPEHEMHDLADHLNMQWIKSIPGKRVGMLILLAIILSYTIFFIIQLPT